MLEHPADPDVQTVAGVTVTVISLLNDYLLSEGDRSASSTLGCTVMASESQTSATSRLDGTRGVPLMDSPPLLDGILCVQPDCSTYLIIMLQANKPTAH